MKNKSLTSLVLSIGIFGCSSVEDYYSFKYQGKDAVVKHENISLTTDKYWIEIEQDKIYSGNITSDDNKLITVISNHCVIRDAVIKTNNH